jgi:hypothetical protein
VRAYKQVQFYLNLTLLAALTFPLLVSIAPSCIEMSSSENFDNMLVVLFNSSDAKLIALSSCDKHDRSLEHLTNFSK